MVIPSLEGWPPHAKEVPPPHEVRLTPLETNPIFRYLGAITSQGILDDFTSKISRLGISNSVWLDISHIKMIFYQTPRSDRRLLNIVF